nr:protein JINGUBANG-like [Tanacetum cinerariifolium]
MNMITGQQCGGFGVKLTEFDILTKLPDCTCEARTELVDHGKLLKLMQFLVGLDDIYQPIRINLLTREIFPEVKDAFVIVLKEESHRGIPVSSVKTKKPQAFAFVSRNNDNNSKRNNENWSNNNGGNVNRGNYDSLLFKNCGLKGHTIDRCFEIIGYPPCFKRNLNLKPSGNPNNNRTNFVDTKGTFVGNNDVKISAGTVSLTNEQVMKLMSLFNEKSGSSANANMAGKEDAATWDGGKSTWGGRAKGFGTVLTPCAYTAHQNGIAERKHIHVLNVARIIMFQGGIPLNFWEPNLSHLRSFRCLCFAAVVKDSDKFSYRSKKCILIGYASEPTTKTPLRPNDVEEGTPGRDGRVHQPEFGATTDHVRHDEEHCATPIGVEFTKRKSDYVIIAFSDSDLAKCLVTGRIVFGNKSAIQIVPNPVVHEKTKHFDIDVHLVKEKVTSGLIRTVKVDYKSQVVDILTKALGTYQHTFLLRPPPMTTTTTTYNLPNHKPYTGTLNLSMHNNHLYAAIGNIIHVIDTSSFTLLDTFNVARTSSGSVKSVTFSNGHIFTAHQDHKIRVWKLGDDNKRQKHIATLPTLEDRLLRSVLPKNYVKVRRHRKKLWIEHYDVVSRLAVINDKLICSVSWDKYLKIWNVGDFRCVQSIKAHDDAINDVIVSADSEIFTGSADGKIKIWGNVLGRKYELITTLEKHKSAGVNALAVNEDGSVLFSGASDCLILVWDKVHGSGNVLNGVLRGHSKAILCLIYVRGSLFSGSADRTLRIWRRGNKGEFCCLKVLDGYERAVRSFVVEHFEAAFESKGGVNVRVFSECSNGVVKICTIEGLNHLESMCIHA